MTNTGVVLGVLEEILLMPRFRILYADDHVKHCILLVLFGIPLLAEHSRPIRQCEVVRWERGEVLLKVHSTESQPSPIESRSKTDRTDNNGNDVLFATCFILNPFSFVSILNDGSDMGNRRSAFSNVLLRIASGLHSRRR